MSQPNTVDEAGIDFIRECEGCELEPYYDQAGLLTNGIGHLLSGPDDEYNRTITMDEAEHLLSGDVEPPECAITDEVVVALNQNQFNALASLIFNIGTGAFRDSTLLRVLNEGDYLGAADQFLVWNKITVDGEKVVSEGLANRREKERALFLEPCEEAAPAPVAPDCLPELRAFVDRVATEWEKGTPTHQAFAAALREELKEIEWKLA